jgi:hypothetical protein
MSEQEREPTRHAEFATESSGSLQRRWDKNGALCPKPEALAEMTCTECGRRPLSDERWSLRFADLGEVAVYCAECDRREFSDGGDLNVNESLFAAP